MRNWIVQLIKDAQHLWINAEDCINKPEFKSKSNSKHRSSRAKGLEISYVKPEIF